MLFALQPNEKSDDHGGSGGRVRVAFNMQDSQLERKNSRSKCPNRKPLTKDTNKIIFMKALTESFREGFIAMQRPARQAWPGRRQARRRHPQQACRTRPIPSLPPTHLAGSLFRRRTLHQSHQVVTLSPGHPIGPPSLFPALASSIPPSCFPSSGAAVVLFLTNIPNPVPCLLGFPAAVFSPFFPFFLFLHMASFFSLSSPPLPSPLLRALPLPAP